MRVSCVPVLHLMAGCQDHVTNDHHASFTFEVWFSNCHQPHSYWLLLEKLGHRDFFKKGAGFHAGYFLWGECNTTLVRPLRSGGMLPQ